MTSAKRPNGSRKPKDGGARRRTMFAYEKGLIWGNDNYRTNGALGERRARHRQRRASRRRLRAHGRPPGRLRAARLSRRRPAPYVDKLLIEGKGGVHHIWACDHYKTTLNADKFKQTYKKRTDLVKDAMSAVPYGDRKAMVDAILAAIEKGGLSRSTSISCRPRSAKPATSGCRRRPRAR